MIHESKLIQTQFSLHHHSAHHGYAERKISTAIALETQNPSEKIGTAISEPSTMYTQDLLVKRKIVSEQQFIHESASASSPSKNLLFRISTWVLCTHSTCLYYLMLFHLFHFTFHYSLINILPSPYHMDLNCKVCNCDSLIILKMSLRFLVSVYIF